MEIEKLIEKVEGIKKTIDDAFDKGSVDFDQIASELDEISGELRASGVSTELEATRRQLLGAKENQLLTTEDYK